MTHDERIKIAQKIAPYAYDNEGVMIYDDGSSKRLEWIDYEDIDEFIEGYCSSIKVCAKRLSQITEEDLIKVAEVATGFTTAKWQFTRSTNSYYLIAAWEHEVDYGEGSCRETQTIGLDLFDNWKISAENETRTNPAYLDTLRQLGYAAQSMFDEGLAIEENE